MRESVSVTMHTQGKPPKRPGLQRFSLYICMRLLLAVHPAERHTAAVAGATGLCDAARYFLVASGDAEPRG